MNSIETITINLNGHRPNIYVGACELIISLKKTKNWKEDWLNAAKEIIDLVEADEEKKCVS